MLSLSSPISQLLLNVVGFINFVLVPLIMAIAFVAFLWGIFQYFIAGAANAEKRTEGQKFVMYSIIGFVLIFSIWGIVGLLMRSFGFGSQVRPPLPSFGAPQQQQRGTYSQGWVCTQDSQCASGQCRIYTAEQGSDGSDPGQKRCL